MKFGYPLRSSVIRVWGDAKKCKSPLLSKKDCVRRVFPAATELGEQALELAVAIPYDVAVVDIMLHSLDDSGDFPCEARIGMPGHKKTGAF